MLHSIHRVRQSLLKSALNLSAVFAVAGTALATFSLQATAISKAPVACSALTELYALGATDLNIVTNTRTGDSLHYTVIGNGASGTKHIVGHKATNAQVLVFLPGNNGIFPDWPLQLLTNSTASPNIKTSLTYKPKQDGSVSLCDDFYIVLFDYPGVGNTQYSGTLTADRIANNVDAMLDDVTSTYGLVTDTVDVVGWSLGALTALKYAMLAPAAKTGRNVGEVILFATKAGGSTGSLPSGNQAQCATAIFDSLLTPGLSKLFENSLEATMFQLMYPFKRQKPYNGTNNGGCTAQVDTNAQTINLSVKTKCGGKTLCQKNLLLDNIAEKSVPWATTDGVPDNLYKQQRNIVADWNFCRCASAGSNYDSQNCACSGSYAKPNAIENGGMCMTDIAAANKPVSYNCVPLKISGALSVIAGKEDLMIQWRYGRELVRAYKRQYGKSSAVFHTFSRKRSQAGHALLVQHPKWAQKRIYKIITGQ